MLYLMLVLFYYEIYQHWKKEMFYLMTLNKFYIYIAMAHNIV